MTAALLAFVTGITSATTFQAPGIEIGHFTWFTAQLKNVNFQ